jgi:formamidopyrimidine-DNA glycosylase
MPELPEVETVRLQLRAKVRGKTIDTVTVYHAKTVGHDEQIADRLHGATIADIDRIGKLLIVSFSNRPDLYVLTHLKMTGQFIYRDQRGRTHGGGHTLTESDTQTLPHRHTRVALRFTDGTELFFNDMRLFGYFRVADPAEVERARGHFGPEPIAPDFDIPRFVTDLRARRAPVKAVLLDQTFVAGLGNIYVDEALWRDRVRPTRRADRVTKAEAAALAAAATAVLAESIAVGGTTFQHFVDTGGEAGNFTDYLKVFGRTGEVCERCGGTIVKTRTAGRGTHYCPGCQK